MYICIINELSKSSGLCSATCLTMCRYTPMCPKMGDKPLRVFALWLCSPRFILLLLCSTVTWCFPQTLLLLLRRTICWLSWRRERRCCKILSLLSSWRYGQEETARRCVMLHSLAFSPWFLGTPQLVLPAFLAISNMFDPIISCVAVSRLIFSCLLTISQVSQAGTGFSDSRLHAGAWQTQLSRCNLLRLTSSTRHLAVNLKQNIAVELPLGGPQCTF